MIDLIIPVYNNYQGLLQTLASINLNIFEITIIDDCSTEKILTNFPVKYIKLNVNSGPGWARQIGINNTKNTYLAFIDAGDVFLSYDDQEEILNTIEENPEVNIFSWPYFINNKKTDGTDNRLHGKVYKRSFLDKYNITFCKEGSYANEDIGFNRTCRICTHNENNPIYYLDIPIINLILNQNSLTYKNNKEFNYKLQNRGLAINSLHMFNILQKNNIDITEEKENIALALYYGFIITVLQRPEFIQQSWDGAKIFYNKFKNNLQFQIKPDEPTIFENNLELYKKLPFTLNIYDFTYEMWNSNVIPKKYFIQGE